MGGKRSLIEQAWAAAARLAWGSSGQAHYNDGDVEAAGCLLVRCAAALEAAELERDELFASVAVIVDDQRAHLYAALARDPQAGQKGGGE
jgi:hypothetical protein